MRWSSRQVPLRLLLFKAYQNIREQLQIVLKVDVPDTCSQPRWHRILNYLAGLFAVFELASFLSPWLCWSRCQINCYLHNSAFLICSFLPFLYIPSHLNRAELDSRELKGDVCLEQPRLLCDLVIKCFWGQTIAFKCERSCSSPCTSL